MFRERNLLLDGSDHFPEYHLKGWQAKIEIKILASTVDLLSPQTFMMIPCYIQTPF